MSETKNSTAVWAIGHSLYPVPTQWRSKRKRHALQGKGLEGASIHFIQPFKNAVLSRNFD